MIHAEIKLTVSQDADCCAPDDLGNCLTVRTANGGVEPDDAYFVLETGRWAINFDDYPGFLNMLEEVFMRVLQANEKLAAPGLNEE